MTVIQTEARSMSSKGKRKDTTASPGKSGIYVAYSLANATELASGKSYGQVLAKARRKGEPNPPMEFVPDEDVICIY